MPVKTDLPIESLVPEIRSHLERGSTLILQAPPGAGKSTVLPLRLLDLPFLKGQKIILLEPRRLAAKAVASRLAQLLGEKPGETVGYRIRFETKIGAKTRIEVVTENILTRMLQRDQELEGVGMVLFDEFHERSLNADLALVLSRQVQQILREDLRLVIMSATLDLGGLETLLQAPVVTSEGRQHPISYQYLPAATSDSIAAKTARAVRKAIREEAGDILVFLPGIGDIRRTEALLEESEFPVALHSLYGDLDWKSQQAALLPDRNGRRKVVLATAIAETSLTIEGIKVVVDSGHARVPRFDPGSGLTRLETVTVTRDAADQRAGRAGRLGPGVCYRLWSQKVHQHLEPHRKPEIMQADLANLALELAGWGVFEREELEWPTPPPVGSWQQAHQLLNDLGAIREGKLTQKGRELLRLPTHPRIGQLLLTGKELDLADLAADVAALLEERDPMGREAGTDLALRVRLLRNWRSGKPVRASKGRLERIERLARAWRKLLKVPANNHTPKTGQVGRLIAAAYPERIARQQSDLIRYRLRNHRKAELPEGDPLVAEGWLAIAHLDASRETGRIWLAAAVNPDDLEAEMEEKVVVRWNGEKGIVEGKKQICIGGLVVKSQPLQKIPDSDRVASLCEAIRQDPKLLNWDKPFLQWQARVMSLRSWREAESWPDVSRKHLLETLESWLTPWLSGVGKAHDLQKLSLIDLLQSTIPWELQSKISRLAPEKFEVPSGSKIRLEYFEDGSPPVLAARLQEMFGLHDTPTVNQGRNKVMVHLLSPARRPVQVTQDLRNFWENTYQEVRKDLRGRYSKHYWPEDPFSAEAIRGVRPRKK